MHDTGNPAALREALVGLFDAYANRKCPASVCDKCNVGCRVNDAWTAAQDALAAPTRNCDWFSTAADALAVYTKDRDLTLSPEAQAFIWWLFEKGGAE